MKAFRTLTILCAGLGLLLTGCLPVTSKAPVGTTVGQGTDPALIGTWRPVPGKGKKDENGPPGYFHLIADRDGTVTALLVSTGEAAKKNGEWSLYRVASATLGGHHYLNVQIVGDNGKPSKDPDANIPVLYRFGPHGRLMLYLMSEKGATAAIHSGAIEGRVDEGKYGDVQLTATPEKLDAFLASDQGAALFTEKLVTLKKAP